MKMPTREIPVLHNSVSVAGATGRPAAIRAPTGTPQNHVMRVIKRPKKPAPLNSAKLSDDPDIVPTAIYGETRPHLVEAIAGYRLVRRLATGTRSTVFLAQAEPLGGVPASSKDDGSDRTAAPNSGSVALKVFDPGTPPALVDAEIGALSAVLHPHLVRLSDVASGPDGLPCLIMDRVNGPSLARILGSRNALWPGEATTILAPICSAVQSLHQSGHSHGFITPGKILLASGGFPVLLGFGRSVERRAGDAHDPGWRHVVLADQRSLLSLCLSVLGALESPGDDDVVRFDDLLSGPAGKEPLINGQDALVEMLGNGPIDAFLPQLERWLFNQAAPMPVRREEFGLSADLSRVDELPPRRLLWQSPTRASSAEFLQSEWPEPDEQPLAPEQPPGRGILSSMLRMLPLPDWVQEASAHPRRPALRRLRGRPVAVAVGVAIALIVCMLLLLPEDPSDLPGEGSSSGGGTVSDPASAEVPGVEPAAAADSENAVEGSQSEAAAITADDPAAALVALSARRDRCFVLKSLDCLGGVHQWQSASGAGDAAILSSAAEGQPAEFVPFDTQSLTTVERTGDSAIVSAAVTPAEPSGPTARNDKPASFLLMKGEAGWRLRDVFFR